MFFVKLFYGLLMIWMWVGIIKYRKQLKWWTGNWVWAEKYVWRWWTYFIMLLLWMLLIFLWATYPFWVLDREPIWGIDAKTQEILSE